MAAWDDVQTGISTINYPEWNNMVDYIKSVIVATGSVQIDGITLIATGSEINYLSGVTSNIQEQLGSKIGNISEDLTPELGGYLDCGAHSVGFTQQSATGDGTTTIDWNLGNKFKFTFGAYNETFTFTDPSKPGNFILLLIQDTSGSRTVTWPASVKWPGGVAPTLSIDADATDIISFYFDGTNYYGIGTVNFD